MILKLDLAVPSDAALIDNLVMRISGMLQGAPCGKDLEAIELALQEALANAIVHGNRNHPALAARLCLAVYKDCRVQVVVKDLGEGFDPSHLRSPVVGENLLASHGRGIFLVKHLMDEVEFRFHGGTEIRMQHHGTADGKATAAACRK
ncbi:MAG: ATP-binding protein [Candidatus Acidiferrales bacterium]